MTSANPTDKESNLTAVDRPRETFVQASVMVVVEVGEDIGSTTVNLTVAEGIHCDTGTCLTKDRKQTDE